jgi:hypothetical protein
MIIVVIYEKINLIEEPTLHKKLATITNYYFEECTIKYINKKSLGE